MNNSSIYIKIPNRIKVNHKNVTLGDIIKIYSSDSSTANKIKSLPLLNITNKNGKAFAVTSIKIVEIIVSSYPNIDVNILGSDDVLISYYPDTKNTSLKIFLYWLKIAFVSLVVFFGGAFTIMSFNNDINISNLFSNIYENIIGTKSNNHSSLEIGYSIGIPLGITIFYNHICNHKITKDPTPLEIEMQRYENDIADTLITGIERKDSKIDVH